MAAGNKIFFDISKYGMSPGIPDVDDIIALNEILCIGGGLIFFPFRKGYSETYRKNPSEFQANNNSIYIDDYMPVTPEKYARSWIPEKFDFLSYIKCYVLFRTVYRRSGYDDFFDIFLNILRKYLIEAINTFDENVNVDGTGLSDEFQTGGRGWQSYATETVLWMVDKFQTGFTLEGLSFKKASQSEIMLTDYPALKKQFFSEIKEIFDSHSTQFTSYLLGNGKDIVSAWAGNIRAGKNPIDILKDSTKQSVEAAFMVDGRLLQMFYELMITTWKYVQTPMPIHTPKKGWSYGYDKEIKFSTDDKASNLILVDVTTVTRQISKSTYVLVEKKPDPVETAAPVEETKKKKPLPKNTICIYPGNVAPFTAASAARGVKINPKRLENYCQAYSNVDGKINETLQAKFNIALEKATIALPADKTNVTGVRIDPYSPASKMMFSVDVYLEPLPLTDIQIGGRGLVAPTVESVEDVLSNADKLSAASTDEVKKALNSATNIKK